MKRLHLLFASTFALFALLFAVATPTYAGTNVFTDACSAPGAKNSSACQNDGSDPIAGANGILAKVTRIVAYLAGIAAVILIIISGFMFVTADGDAGKVSSARTTLIYAVVGVAIVVVAQGIIMFVVNRL